jgi:hypothetical protein
MSMAAAAAATWTSTLAYKKSRRRRRRRMLVAVGGLAAAGRWLLLLLLLRFAEEEDGTAQTGALARPVVALPSHPHHGRRKGELWLLYDMLFLSASCPRQGRIDLPKRSTGMMLILILILMMRMRMMLMLMMLNFGRSQRGGNSAAGCNRRG